MKRPGLLMARGLFSQTAVAKLEEGEIYEYETTPGVPRDQAEPPERLSLASRGLKPRLPSVVILCTHFITGAVAGSFARQPPQSDNLASFAEIYILSVVSINTLI